MKKLRDMRQAVLQESGQDTFEYLLAVAGIAVVLLAALIIGFEALVPQVVDHTCPSIDTASNVTPTNGSCIQNLP